MGTESAKLRITVPAEDAIHASNSATLEAPAVLCTIHGSRLYGLAHEGSDYDQYRVVLSSDKRFARQGVNGSLDSTILSLDRFTEQVAAGVPQALEALFSTQKLVDARYQEFFAGLRPGINEARMRYRRTILNFAFGRGGRTGSAAERIDARKLRRHALRLALNFQELQWNGRFDPTLSPQWIAWVKHVADAEEFEEVIRTMLDSALYPTA